MSTLDSGSRLGPYEILELRGKGGMGEVYRAHDSRLERDVAIKVLPEALGNDSEFRRRFEREAKTISQLQHSHVCTLYDIGSEGDRSYLVMELLDGETLEERLSRGPLALDDVITIGAQIAEGIEAAHRRNLVHRDLKPGNVRHRGVDSNRGGRLRRLRFLSPGRRMGRVCGRLDRRRRNLGASRRSAGSCAAAHSGSGSRSSLVAAGRRDLLPG